MTNEEKARKLAHDYFRRGQLGLCSPDTESAGYECAMKMAEWKEQQMINKAVNFLNENLMRTLLFDEHDKENFINNFKKAIEEQL